MEEIQFLNKRIIENMRLPLHITQHRSFPREIACVISRGHPNPSLSLRTSFVLKTLYEMAVKRKIKVDKNE